MELCLCPGPAEEGLRLAAFLRGRGVSASAVRSVKYAGGAFLAGAERRPVHTDYGVRAGEPLFLLLPPEAPSAVEPQTLPLAIAYEDEWAAVLDKPAGMAVHPTLNAPSGTLANAWLGELARRGKPGVFRPVNRLDKNTSGLVLAAQNAFAAPFLAKSARKAYVAFPGARLPLGPGLIDAPIARAPGSIIGRCVAPGGKPSRTAYTVVWACTDFSVALCRLLTGRTHQIRVHFASQGAPLVGDGLYGGNEALLPRQALHCAGLSFSAPLTGEERLVQSPLPGDMAAVLPAGALAALEEGLGPFMNEL